eukprot:CAMPEP_0168417336 /NCGR_PEP_ID=MMETSP0228-20121227/31201_1 /TAXON_ID=133427 /ORGANISM="Protoceratium reticulatum, Strain CCCM 535 (=CCMP 1889)" /LENGTH=38 /DNA_ID= /DNA_START= /DNA_END= /DNA_ORIENTATION=
MGEPVALASLPTATIVQAMQRHAPRAAASTARSPSSLA